MPLDPRADERFHRASKPSSNEDAEHIAPPDFDALCISCKKPMGDHTMRENWECSKNNPNWHAPYREVPNGPLMFKGLKGTVSGGITYTAGWIDSNMGRVPMIQHIFTVPGDEPDKPRALDPITLVLDPQAFKTARQQFSHMVDVAITSARRGTREGFAKI